MLPNDLKVAERKTSEAAEPLKMDAEEDRKPRSTEDMVKEAEWLKTFFANSSTLEL